MVNTSNTEAYTFLDTIFASSVRSLSRLIGVKNITKPFWNRWRASLIGDETITNFLNSIHSIDDWPIAAERIIRDEESRFAAAKPYMTRDQVIIAMRRLSYLCHMAQWGCLAITDNKRELYKLSRDYYNGAASLAQDQNFQRIPIPWKSKACYGNLHLPTTGRRPYPLITILHGMDDTKEEHGSTILALQDKGFAVFCIDGPGQGESLLISDIKWEADYCDCIAQAIASVCEDHSCDPQRVGLLGISWGGMWAVKMAAHSPQIRAIYDLGGPIDTRLFAKLPFFLKTKFCQVMGITGPQDLPGAEELFSIKDTRLLNRVNCSVRIVHGGKDPIVPASDKHWLESTLHQLHPHSDISLVIHKTGDHCCTGQAEETREDVGNFFSMHLAAGTLKTKSFSLS